MNGADAHLWLFAEVHSVSKFSSVHPLAQVKVVAEDRHCVLLGGAVEHEQALHIPLRSLQLFPLLLKPFLKIFVLHNVNALNAEVHVESMIGLHFQKLSFGFSKSIGQRVVLVKLSLWNNIRHFNSSLCFNHISINPPIGG